MSSRPWYKRYGADFVHGVVGLGPDVIGAYTVILDLIYDRGGPIPNDPRFFAGILGCSTRMSSSLIGRLLALGKLSEEDGKLTNRRAIQEIENASKTARTLAESGAKGGRNSRQKLDVNNETKDLAEASLKHTRINQKPETREEEPNGSLSEKGSDVQPPTRRKRTYSPDFEAFWKAFPTDALMSKAKAFQAWQKLDVTTRNDVAASVPSFVAYCNSKPDYRPVHAVRYITEERYVGFLQTAAKSAGRVFVAVGTPEWAAWQRVQKVTPVRSEQNQAMGWWYPTKTPAREWLDSAA